VSVSLGLALAAIVWVARPSGEIVPVQTTPLEPQGSPRDGSPPTSAAPDLEKRPTVKPPPLRPGGTIGIVSPASGTDEKEVQRAVANLRRRGYRVKLALGYRQPQGFLAAADSVRAAEINGFFADDEVDALLCLRGGYGSSRILDRLDYELIRRRPKILVGYSDITALLNAVHLRAGVVTFHGPMAKEFGEGDGLSAYSEKYFWAAFRPESPLFADWGGGLPNGRAAMTALAGGTAEGVLVGGNLSVLTSTLGTPFELAAQGGILFLEEVNEKAFRIDRMLNQLRLSGKLRQARGVLLGSFSGCGSDLEGTSLKLSDVFTDYFAGLGVPVLAGYPTGHVADQVVLPIGVRVLLDADAKKLAILEPPVAELPSR
jgi:muramoyltetrapeptide carboxypeptidase